MTSGELALASGCAAGHARTWQILRSSPPAGYAETASMTGRRGVDSFDSPADRGLTRVACASRRRGHGSSVLRLRAQRARRGRAVPGGARSLRDVSGRGGAGLRPGRVAAVHRGRVSRLLALRVPCRGLRPISVCPLPAGPAGTVFLQGPGGVSELRRPPDGRARGAPGRSRVPRRPRSPVGPEPAAPPAVRGPGSSGSAATRCVRRWRTIGST